MSLLTNENTNAEAPTEHGRLRGFVDGFGRLLESSPGEAGLLRQGSSLLAELVSEDDWLPERFALAGAERYRQYLLYVDPAERFSVVSFVWGPGQSTPIHNHTTWGLIGMLRGSEVEQHYSRDGHGKLVPDGEPHRLVVGAVDAVSPSVGDLHRVSNAYEDRVSISIHVYGGDIGSVQRSVYGEDGTAKSFVSGYWNDDPIRFDGSTISDK